MSKNLNPLNPTQSNAVEYWIAQVRRQTSRQVPIETAFSLPVPIIVQKKQAVAAFYYGIQRQGRPEAGLALPPVARLIAAYPEPRLIEFLHKQAQLLFPDLPAHGDLGLLLADPELKIQQRMENRKKLFDLYPPIVDAFFKNMDDKYIRQQFFSAFSQLAEPGLLPYYRALNPEFFNWLNEK